MIKKPSRLALFSKTALGSIAFLGILAIAALIAAGAPVLLEVALRATGYGYTVSEDRPVTY